MAEDEVTPEYHIEKFQFPILPDGVSPDVVESVKLLTRKVNLLIDEVAVLQANHNHLANKVKRNV